MSSCDEGDETEDLVADEHYCALRIGRGVALVGVSTFVLVDAKNGAFGERLWAHIVAGAGVDELLEELSATGLRSLGDFAMAQLEDDDLRVVVRGDAQAIVTHQDQTSELNAEGVRTWVEHPFAQVDGFTLALGPLSDEHLPYRVHRGIIPADMLRWSAMPPTTPSLTDLDLDWVDSIELASVGEHGRILQNPPDSLTQEPSDQEELRDQFQSDPETEAEAEATELESIELGQRITEDEPDPEPEDNSELYPGAATGEHQGPRPGPAAEVSDDGYDYDSLYGHTVAKSVQSAAVHTDQGDDIGRGPADGPVAESSADENSFVRPDSDSSIETIAPPAGAISADRLIMGVPSDDIDQQNPAEMASSVQLGDHDGHTVSKAQIQALKAQSANLSASESGGPLVQALVCSGGHPNPPQSTQCRTCGNTLTGAPVMAPRPTLGHVSFSSGQSIDLDRPAIIGRNPKIEGQYANEVPQLVKIDVGQALSRSHAILRLEAWQVLVEDLGSANGTMVTLPGREPRRLHSGEPVLLLPGSLIDFGGEVTASYVEAG